MAKKKASSPPPSLRIEMWSLDRIKPYDKNPRRNDQSVDAVAASLVEFGFRQPIVVDADGVIIAGHTRFKAATKLNLLDVPVHVATDLTPEQIRAYRIADNKVADLSLWDDDVLAKELAALREVSIDMKSMGFDQGELDRLLTLANGPIEEDEIPSVPVDPIAKPGDLWLLGRHRLLCGDSTKREDVERVMRGERATCIFTDPPYGVSVAAKNRLLNTVQKAGRCLEDIVDDDLTPAQLEERLIPAFELIRTVVMADDCTLFVSAPQGGELGMMMMMMMQKSGLRVRHVLIWKKNAPTFSLGRLDYDYQHEPILLTWCARHKRPMNGMHKTSVWSVDKPRASGEHPTMKPVELYANAYLNNSDSGDVVYDAYSGSGTAFIAAEQTERRCRAIEIEPRYVDVAVARWEALTGEKAVLEARE